LLAWWGLFMTNQSYWLNAYRFSDEPSGIRHKSDQSPPDLTEHATFPFHESYGGECPGVYYIRLQRDGWRLIGRDRHQEDNRFTFEKTLPNGWVIRKVAHATTEHPVGTGCYYDTHSLHHADRDATIDCQDWEWADLDGDRLVWVVKGVLIAAELTSEGLGSARTLYDFNPLTFEAIEAPY
jgi:hypothetical protein